MKTLLNVTVTAIGLLCIMAFASIGVNKKVNKIPKHLEANPVDIEITSVNLNVPELDINIKDHDAFLDAIGHFESGNRYTIVNRYGYMGRYQFGKSTLRTIDINVSRNTFLNSPELQEEAMYRLLTHNQKLLKRFIDKYEGKYIHGVYITESGILAAAHLAGAGNVRKFFRRGYEFRDGNGTKMTSYMKIFSGYQLDI